MRLPVLAAALAALPSFLVLAADAADPGAPTPPPAYRSVFTGTPTGVEEDSVDWRKANADVARFPRGHADVLKWEEREGSAPATAPRPAASAAHTH